MGLENVPLVEYIVDVGHDGEDCRALTVLSMLKMVACEDVDDCTQNQEYARMR